MLDVLIAVILGIVEGITEWLPISSTGHMILLEKIMPMKVSSDFWEMYLVVIQLGAILAVVLMFWNQLWPFCSKEKGYIKKDTFSMWFKIIVACVPAAVVELVWGDQLEAAFYHYQVVALMLILVGIVFLIVERWNKERDAKVTTIAQITYRAAFMIGMFQLIAALFPGTSRSGATIVGALLIGVSREVAAEFTFFLGIPTMFGASLLKIFSFLKDGGGFSGPEAIYLFVGMVVSFAVSIIVIRFLMSFIKKHDFKPFGIYRIVLGLAVIAFLVFA